MTSTCLSKVVVIALTPTCCFASSSITDFSVLIETVFDIETRSARLAPRTTRSLYRRSPQNSRTRASLRASPCRPRNAPASCSVRRPQIHHLLHRYAVVVIERSNVKRAFSRHDDQHVRRQE